MEKEDEDEESGARSYTSVVTKFLIGKKNWIKISK